MQWTRILAYITGTVDQELLLRNKYLSTGDRMLRAQIKGGLLLSDADKKALASIGYRLGRKALEDVANSAKPDMLLGWSRKLLARKFDGSKSRRYPGRPRVAAELEQRVLRMARENIDWGYDRIVGALANLGYTLSDELVANFLRRNGIPPAVERKRTTTWRAFIRTHMAVLAGTDFFTVEVLTLRGLATCHVLFFTHLESRRDEVAGITPHPNEAWMKQIARNFTIDKWDFLGSRRYLIHDPASKFCESLRSTIRSGGSCGAADPARPKSEFERPHRALGTLGERQGAIKVDPGWGEFRGTCFANI